jgi:hypothetical protein
LDLHGGTPTPLSSFPSEDRNTCRQGLGLFSGRWHNQITGLRLLFYINGVYEGTGWLTSTFSSVGKNIHGDSLMLGVHFPELRDPFILKLEAESKLLVGALVMVGKRKVASAVLRSVLGLQCSLDGDDLPQATL